MAKNNIYKFNKYFGTKVYIYRPDMAKIRPDLLYTLKGKPFFEDRQETKEIKDKIEDIRDMLVWQKLRRIKK